MNTHDLDDPFGEHSIEANLEVAGRSVVLLAELSPKPEEKDNRKQKRSSNLRRRQLQNQLRLGTRTRNRFLK